MPLFDGRAVLARAAELVADFEATSVTALLHAACRSPTARQALASCAALLTSSWASSPAGSRIATAEDLAPLVEELRAACPDLATVEDFIPLDPRRPVHFRAASDGRSWDFRVHPGGLESPLQALQAVVNYAEVLDPVLLPRFGYGVADMLQVAGQMLKAELVILAPAWDGQEVSQESAPAVTVSIWSTDGKTAGNLGTSTSATGPAAAILRRRAASGVGVVLQVPVAFVQRILHDLELAAIDRVGRRLMEGPHQRQARFLHHPPRSLIDRHRLRDHTLHTELSEALTDQRTRPLSGIPSAPSRLAQPVPKLDLAGRGVLTRPEMEPPQEFPGGLLDDRPETEALIPPVIAKECGQIYIFDLLAGRGRPAGDEAHDIGISIQAHQVVRISNAEPAKHQSLRLQENLHRPALPVLPRYPHPLMRAGRGPSQLCMPAVSSTRRLLDPGRQQEAASSGPRRRIARLSTQPDRADP